MVGIARFLGTPQKKSRQPGNRSRLRCDEKMIYCKPRRVPPGSVTNSSKRWLSYLQTNLGWQNLERRRTSTKLLLDLLSHLRGNLQLEDLQLFFLQAVTTQGGPNFEENTDWFSLHGIERDEWIGLGLAFHKRVGKHSHTQLTKVATSGYVDSPYHTQQKPHRAHIGTYFAQIHDCRHSSAS